MGKFITLDGHDMSENVLRQPNFSMNGGLEHERLFRGICLRMKTSATQAQTAPSFGL